MVRRASREDDEQLSVAELLEELREAKRYQNELLSVLHSDGEARTRAADGGRSFAQISAVFVLGILIGTLSTYAGIAGRLATLEAGQQQQAQLTSGLRDDVRALRDQQTRDDSPSRP